MTMDFIPNGCPPTVETAAGLIWVATINSSEREIEVRRAKPDGPYLPGARIRCGGQEYVEFGPSCSSLDAAVRLAVAMVGPATVRSGLENCLSYW